MAKLSISVPRVKQESIPRPMVPTFSAGRALSEEGDSKPRGVFRPLAKAPAPAKSSWTNH